MKLRKISLFLILLWLILAGLIVWLKVVPFGKATYSVTYPARFNLLGAKGFIGHLTPAERIKVEPNNSPEIIGDPVYFSVFTPRTFNEAKITITYQDNLSSSTPVIEAGVLVDNLVWRYKLAPMENKWLDNYFSNWQKIEKEGVVLLQKNNKYASITDFLADLKNKPQEICASKKLSSCVAFYNTASLNLTLLKEFDLKVNNSFFPINVPLQGAHQFYFYLDKDDYLNFDLEITDLNLDKKADPVVASIYKNEEKRYSLTINDNEGVEGSGSLRNFSLPLNFSPEKTEAGLYKLEIKTSDDVVIKRIIKAPAALNVIGRLHPVNNSKWPLNLWTNDSFIKVTTNNPANLQTISFGDQRFALTEAYQQFEFSVTNSGLKKISLEKDDVYLETAGVFSFSRDSFFNPNFIEVNQKFVPLEELNYVLAVYRSPEINKNASKKATIILNTKEAYREKGKYSFMISVPGLSLANEGSLLIKEIKIEFSGRTIFDKLQEKIKEYVN